MLLDLLCQLDAADGHCRVVEPFESEHRPDALLDPPMVLVNGLITNDKFCMARIGQQKLRYLRRPRSSTTCHATDCREYLRDERQHRGGAHETTVASPSSASVDGGCGAAL